MPLIRMAVSAQDIAASPAWFPLESAGPGAMRLVRLDQAAYRSASFLDRRLMQTGSVEACVDGGIVAAAAARLIPQSHYIFHTGHVGSTLVSRLVGQCEGLFSIREPALLRELAVQPRPGHVPGGIDLRDTLALLARTWSSGQRTVVKATSFASELAEPILGLDPGSSAVLMFTPALAYLRCILGGPNSRVEAKTLAASRLARLRSRLVQAAPGVDPRSEGEWIAMSWLCEMVCLRQAAARFGSRVLWVDFDAFLSAPEAGLASILRTFAAEATLREVARILSGPLMRQYSKAPEHAYDAALRQEVLAGADREHGDEIRRGMQWLAGLTGRHPLIDAVLRAPS